MLHLPPLHSRGFATSLLLVALTWSCPAGAEGEWFDGSAFIPVGFSGPENSFGSGVLADLDGDGAAELIIADRPNDRLEVRRGLGGGELGPPTYYAPGDFPMEVSVGDVTGDGHPDVVVTNYFGSQSISVLPGNGDTTLGPRVQYATSTSPRHAAIVDYDQDGRLDVVISCNAGLDVLNLFRGVPGGGFAPRVAVATGDFPRASALADFDGDGIADLAASCENGVAFHRGLGGGAFAPFVLLDAAGTHGPIEAADLDGDTDPDLVIADGRGCCHAIVVVRNLGAGAFSPGLALGDGEYCDGLAIADLDADGVPEIMTITPGRNAVDVLRSADGFLSATQQSFQAGFYPQALSVGDLDGDGRDDACVGALSSFLALLRGNGDGTLGAMRSVPADPVPLGLDAGDLDGDGLADLLVSHGDGQLRVQRAEAAGGFGAPSLAGSSGFAVRLVDLDADGHLDAVAVLDGFLTSARGAGNGSFFSPQVVPVIAGTAGFDLGDVNGDGILDAVVVGQGAYPMPGGVSTLLGRGDGTFDPEIPSLTFHDGWFRPALADFDGDDTLDLALLAFDDTLRVFHGRGDGTYAPRSAIYSAYSISALLALRWDADAWADLIMLTADDRLRVFRGDGTGQFTAGDSMAVIGVGFVLQAAALDSTSSPELVLASFHGVVHVVRGDGMGGFAEQTTYGTCAHSAGMAITDTNRDGVPDLVMSCQQADMHSILLNQGPGVTSTRPAFSHVEIGPDRIRIQWSGAAIGALHPTVERRGDAESAWTSLGPPTTIHRDLVIHDDFDVAPGGEYGYRLAFDDPGGRTTTAETRVGMDAAYPLALEAVHPNPVPRGGRLSLTLSLTSDAPAGIQLLDVRGRILRTIALPNPSPQRNSFVVPSGWDVPPGVYFLRLSQGGASSIRKLTVAGP